MMPQQTDTTMVASQKLENKLMITLGRVLLQTLLENCHPKQFLLIDNIQRQINNFLNIMSTRIASQLTRPVSLNYTIPSASSSLIGKKV
jgi:hypothetical protein